jgi:hypothetical protein
MRVAVCVGVNTIAPDIEFCKYLFLLNILFFTQPVAFIALLMCSRLVLMTTPSLSPIGTRGNGAP